MAKAIFQTKSFTASILKFPEKTSVKQNAVDGDTLRVKTDGSFNVRFLGVDSAEAKFLLDGFFVSLSSDKWKNYFDMLYESDYFKSLPEELRFFLQSKIKDNPTENQYKHAKETERWLEAEITKDMAELRQDAKTFNFFMVFAYEILDSYGRFLGYINRSQPEGDRPLAYNERMLQAGVVTPYFIWPNINPFRKQSDPYSLKALNPTEFWKFTNADYTLQRARKWVKENREKGNGIFSKVDPLQLQPFELRFLGRKEWPSRFVIDLEKVESVILRPEDYFKIENIEDRLFIPAEYVPLFEKAGWRIE